MVGVIRRRKNRSRIGRNCVRRESGKAERLEKEERKARGRKKEERKKGWSKCYYTQNIVGTAPRFSYPAWWPTLVILPLQAEKDSWSLLVSQISLVNQQDTLKH